MVLTRSQSNKRRRTSPPNGPIASLPDDVLTSVAAFLPNMTAVLFAVALSKSRDGKCQPSSRGKAVISSIEGRSSENPWAVMNFLDIEFALRSKINDALIANILVCIDATETVKILKLPYLTQIDGSGLWPLRGSTILEQLDLTQCGQYGRQTNVGAISLETVIPILNSIIDKDISALRHMQFPKKWIDSDDPMFQTFLQKYERFLAKKNVCCSSCYDLCEGEINLTKHGGLQLNTCYSCLETLCYECQEHSITQDICEECKKVYCQECNPVEYCEQCHVSSCEGCGSIDYCVGCDTHFCRSCGHGDESSGYSSFFSDY